MAFPAGDKSKMVVIQTHDQRYKFTLVEGEMAIHDDLGQSVHLTRTGITINGGGNPITITNAPTVTQHGDLHATGAIIAGYGTGDQAGLQTHRHGTGTNAAGTVAPTAGT
jgi:phage gp45-like